MNFKISPLWLFLLLLIVLIIPTMFIKPLIHKETFIGFYGTTVSNTSGLTIPNYPNPVDKLYDNDFFDPKNGNLLRVYGSALDAKSGQQDTTGLTIDHIDVIDRSSNTSSFASGQPITAGSLTSVPNSYLTWTAFSTDPAFANITSDQIVYCSWGQDTYLHVLDLNNSLNACGFLYSGGGGAPIYTNFNAIYRLGVAKADNTVRNYIVDSGSKMVMYQLTNQIAYVPSTGDIRFLDGTGNNLIYNRSGQSIAAFSTSGTIMASTKPWVEYDLVGNLMMIYVPNQKKTTIVILKLNTDGITFAFVCVCRFNADGSLQVDANTVTPVPTNLAGAGAGAGSSGSCAGAAPAPAPASCGAVGGGGAAPSGWGNQDINDYILKTNLIAPICPSCPNCPNVIVSGSTPCPSCGTGAPSAAPVAAPSAVAGVAAPAPAPAKKERDRSPTRGTPSGVYKGLKQAGHETGEILEDTAKGVVSLGKEGTKGAVDLGRDVAKGTVGLGKEIIGSTVGLGRELAHSTVGLGREIAGGVTGIGRGIGHEVGEIFREDERDRNIRRDGGYGDRDWEKRTGGGGGGGGGAAGTGYYSQTSQSKNQFDYQGQLSDRGTSEFIPIVSDFSAFGR